MNTVNLSGRLTKEPDVRYNQNQMAVARFNLAIDRYANGEKKTDFPSIVCFGKVAENVERYTDKGLRVEISGRIQTGSYKSNEGKTIYTTDVVAEKVEFIDWKEKSNNNHNEEAMVPTGFEELAEDLPF